MLRTLGARLEAETRRFVWIPPHTRTENELALPEFVSEAPRNVSAGMGRRGDLNRAGATAATQPGGCELANGLWLLIRASTCKRIRSCRKELRRGRIGRILDPVTGQQAS
jgi:hypothetical protein